MGPYPHEAPPAKITTENPAGTDGFGFVEYVHPDPAALHSLFRTMGFTPVAKHRSKAITLYRQGEVNYLAQRGAPQPGRPLRGRAWSLRRLDSVPRRGRAARLSPRDRERRRAR